MPAPAATRLSRVWKSVARGDPGREAGAGAGALDHLSAAGAGAGSQERLAGQGAQVRLAARGLRTARGHGHEHRIGEQLAPLEERV